MRPFLIMAVGAAVLQLTTGWAAAQETPTPQQQVNSYEPESYRQLLNRIERLESNREFSTRTIGSDGIFYGQYDNVIVKPFLSENSAFPAQDADSNITNQPFDLDFEYSPRLEIGYLAPTSELGFRARYWHFEGDASVGPADDANGLIASDAVGLAVGATLQDVDTITVVVYDLNMDVLDLEATRSVGNGTFAGGIRTAWTGQRYFADTDEGDLTTNLDMTAIGPTLAYEWKSGDVWIENLSCLAGVRGSLLYGGKKVNSIGENNFASNTDALIYNAEAQLGMEYRPSNGFFLRAALETQLWANTGNATNQNIGAGDDIGDDEFVSNILDDDLGFLGMVFSIGYEW